MKPLRICLDARLPDATIGGGAKVVIGLATGFSKLTDGDEEYHFHTLADANDWISPYLKGPCRLFSGPSAPKNILRKRLARITWLKRGWHWASYPVMRLGFKPPVSDGKVEDAGFDLIHFTQQHAFLTSLPNIYQPHDLQHLHYPQIFSARERWRRAVLYRAFCQQAQMVVAMSQWGKQDLINHLRLPAEKIQVVPWGAWTDAPAPSPADLQRTQNKFQLPESFIFLPGQTWVHKNHIAVVQALKLLKETRGLKIPFVCSGQMNESFPKLQDSIQKLGMSDQVKFVGFVTELELESLYRLARALVFPTKFEGWGLPIMEAFHAGLPVICSDVTCLPAQAGDAALLCGPDDISKLSEHIFRVWTDATLRQDLIARGHDRVSQFSWDRTARIFRAHYRRLAQRHLSAEDQSLLTAPPLV